MVATMSNTIPITFEEDALVNYNNYYIYADMVRNRTGIELYVPEALARDNIDDHIEAILNILKDGIETDYVHDVKITLRWENDVYCRLTIFDYWLNLFVWEMLLKTGTHIRPKHIFLGTKSNTPGNDPNRLTPWEVKRKDIRQYINKYVLTLENKINIGNHDLNKIVAYSMSRISYLEHFAFYFANTINNEDDIALMNACPEYDALIHSSLAGVPIEDVKDKGQMLANRAIELIKSSEQYIGYEHGLVHSFRANEAINPRQFKEAQINIGTKPNGQGGIYPYIIDRNFKTGGVNSPLDYFIESSTARIAQILSKTNVGESGDFARLVGLNNTDTILNPDPDFSCLSKHFIEYEVKSKAHLSMIKNRFYRLSPNGLDFCVDYENDTHLIDKKIYLHSPMTCGSASLGRGICRKCYGNLYYTNININIGKVAAEILTAMLTQILLSAKHLLEAMVRDIKWNPEFKDFFNIDINSIKLGDDLLDDDNLKKFTLLIDPDNIQLVSEEEEVISTNDEGNEVVEMDGDSGVYNEYITSFSIVTPDGREIQFGSEDQHELYISQELNTIIRRKAYSSDGRVAISLKDIGDSILFYIKITNNEISKTMYDIMNIINKSSVTEGLTKDQAVQRIVDLVLDGHLDIDAVHLEVILSNQIVDPKDILKKPNWNSPAAMYRMFTLNQALTNNPSVIISLLYKDLGRTLYNPLTYAKNAPSFFDLFFHQQPQVYMDSHLYTTDTSHIQDYDAGIKMCTVVSQETREEEFMQKLRDMKKN